MWYIMLKYGGIELTNYIYSDILTVQMYLMYFIF